MRSTWAIGDVQGCFAELQALLARIGFDPARDRLWFVGDLVARGPGSLATLRFVRSLGRAATVVLGNHDLHLLALAHGVAPRRRDASLAPVLAAPERDELVGWLCTRSLLHVEGGWALVHAGLLPQWSVARARDLAAEVEAVLASARAGEFLRQMHGDEPRRWDESLTGAARLRVIVNALTRLRYCTPEGAMHLGATGLQAPPGARPWFELRPCGETETIVFGHWSALGVRLGGRIAALDSGCVWGGALSALRLEDRRLVQVPCRRSAPATAAQKGGP